MKLALALKPYDIDSLDNRDPEVIERLCRLYHKPLSAYFRFEVSGMERVERTMQQALTRLAALRRERRWRRG